MQKAIIGKKLGMTQLFDENGSFIPVTVIEAGPCVVVQKKTAENDGYESVQLGFGEVSDKHVNKPMKGHSPSLTLQQSTPCASSSSLTALLLTLATSSRQTPSQ